MITILKEEKFNLTAFLKKEDITFYRFAIMSKVPLSSIYSIKNNRKRITAPDFEKMMENYQKAKKSDNEKHRSLK